MAAKICHGARALVSVTDPNTNQQRVVGIWNNFSYSVSYDVIPAYILGRFSAAELTTVGYAPVNITAGGYRVIDHGFQTEGAFTQLAQMLQQEYLTLSVLDRQTGKLVATISGCVPTATTASISARQLVEGSNTFMGLLYADEQFVDAESPTSAVLP